MFAAKEQGLLLCWNFIMSSPEPLPIEKPACRQAG
jgi:hypothetical protein